MNSHQWEAIIYRALEIPAAVVDKRAVAGEVLAKEFSFPASPDGADDPSHLERYRGDAERDLLDGLAEVLESGALDRALVHLETATDAANKIAPRLGHVEPEALEARALVLEHVVERIVSWIRLHPDAG